MGNLREGEGIRAKLLDQGNWHLDREASAQRGELFSGIDAERRSEANRPGSRRSDVETKLCSSVNVEPDFSCVLERDQAFELALSNRNRLIAAALAPL